MRVSLNWLKDFVELPEDAESLAREITDHCFEVEKVIGSEQNKYKFSNVFVARVLSVSAHPNADRLRVVSLELGPEKIVEPVVCGANNFVAGDLVALALPGAIIPQDIHSEKHESMVLAAATIRGVQSQGMICSAFELGLSAIPEQKPEILLLPSNAQPGSTLAEFLTSQHQAPGQAADQSADQVVLELALPSNRPDLFSHLGIARELGGLLGYKLHGTVAALHKLASSKPDAEEQVKVEIAAKDACTYYAAARLKVTVGHSPQFIQERLIALGLRPINNVVDITNYVMHELGQPLHAFDASGINGALHVRYATHDEKLITIDHKQRLLSPAMMVIADNEKALALAGIIGGEGSEIGPNTLEILLEAANFEASSVRRTAKSLGMRTEASAFFEKGLSVEQAAMGMSRAIELLKKYAGAELLAFGSQGKSVSTPRKIVFTIDQVNGLIGSDFTLAQSKKYLKQLGFKFSGGKAVAVQIPYYRKDIESSADIADEFIKIVGMDLLLKTPLAVQRTGTEVNTDKPLLELKEHMAGLGLFEVQNYIFISESDISGFGLDKTEFIKVKNPLSADQAYLKRHLLIPLLKNVQHNAKQFDDFGLFEIGKQYITYLDEPDLLTYVLYSKVRPEQLLFAQAKGLLEQLLEKYTAEKPHYEVNDKQLLTIKIGKAIIGNMGPVSSAIKQAFDISHALVYVKINLVELFKLAGTKKFVQYSKFPEKILDISLVVDADMPWQKIESIVQGNAGELLRDIELFEAPWLYPSQLLPKFHKELLATGRKNLAFHVVYASETRTLKDSEILPIHAKIQEELKERLGAEIR